MEPVRPDIATRSATPGVAIGNASARDTFAKRMAIDVSVVRDLAALRALEADWRSLAAGVLFRGPEWLIPWWLAYHNTLHGELHVLVGRASEADASGVQAGDVVCIAPLYRRTIKVALIDTRELR